MRARLRSGWRFATFALLSAFCFVMRACVRLLARHPARERRWRAYWMQFWGRSLMRLLRIRVRVEGPVPQPPFLLVSNHLSYLDIPLLASLTGSVFVSKKDVADWPLIGPAVSAFDTIYVDRENRRSLKAVNTDTLERYRSGDGVTIFPEGTSTSGNTVLPLMPSLLDAAACEDIPVHHVSIGYQTPDGQPPAATHVCWWGDMDFLPHFAALLRIPTFDAMLHFGAESIHNADRKALAAALHGRMNEVFRPLDQSGVGAIESAGPS